METRGSEASPAGLQLRDVGTRGQGVFALAPIAKGAVVLVFGGPRLARDDVDDFTHVLQVGPDEYLGASHDVDDYVNHSCEPNCVVRDVDGEMRLVALRDLAAGDEVTFDYSTCMLDEPSIERCLCGASSCRGSIRPFGQLLPEDRVRLLARRLVPAFVRRTLRSGS